MGKGYCALFAAASFALFCGTASAYTLTGTVSDTSGSAIKGAGVALLNKGKSTVTDDNGKFTIQEEEEATTGIQSSKTLGHFSLNNGILTFTQNASAPTLVKIFDLMGNQVFAKSFQGSGSVNLNDFVDAQGNYLAFIKMGNAKQSFRFTAQQSYAGSVKQNGQNQILKKETDGSDTLQVSANGFDTLKIALSNLDTTLDIKLNQVLPATPAEPEEPQYSFGYALKNAPTPSKGCGKNSSLQGQKVENGEKFYMDVKGLKREFFITLPENYDNTKPYKVLFAHHCMGSNAEDFVHHAPDYDHPTPYYGQQVLDTAHNYIFVSPRGDTDGMPWSTTDDKDHVFFGELLTAIEDNYCIDTSRVFATGFSFGAMFTNSLAQTFQDRIRAVAVYAVADFVIWIPKNAGKPIAWMGVHGKRDGTCPYNSALTSALPRILKNNGPDGTDVSSEKPEEFQGTAGHLCYDFKQVDPRFPVKWCSWNGEHQWTAHDGGNTSTGAGWQDTWVPTEVHKFFEQF